MAIYITDKDGNDQHFDTIEEFERAMIFMSRLGGVKPPQDLVDEVKERDSEALEKERLTDFIVGKAKDGGMHEIVLAQGDPIKFFGDGEVDDEETEFYAGDIVYVTKTIDGAIMSKGDIEEGLAEIANGMVFENSLIRQGSNWGNFKTDNIDHRDKVRLVCRAEDRKDKDYVDK